MDLEANLQNYTTELLNLYLTATKLLKESEKHSIYCKKVNLVSMYCIFYADNTLYSR
jgi:hypothetical protein